MSKIYRSREYRMNQAIEKILLNPNEIKKLSDWEVKFLRGLNQSFTVSNSLSVKQKNRVIPILKRLDAMI